MLLQQNTMWTEWRLSGANLKDVVEGVVGEAGAHRSEHVVGVLALVRLRLRCLQPATSDVTPWRLDVEREHSEQTCALRVSAVSRSDEIFSKCFRLSFTLEISLKSTPVKRLPHGRCSTTLQLEEKDFRPLDEVVDVRADWALGLIEKNL